MSQTIELIPSDAVKAFMQAADDIRKTADRLAKENLQLRLKMEAYKVSEVAKMLGQPNQQGAEYVFAYLKTYKPDILRFGDDKRQIRIPGDVAEKIINSFKQKYKP